MVDGGNVVVMVFVWYKMDVAVLVRGGTVEVTVVVIGGTMEVIVVVIGGTMEVILDEHPVTIKRADKSSKAAALWCTPPLCIYFFLPLFHRNFPYQPVYAN